VQAVASETCQVIWINFCIGNSRYVIQLWF
jgi:hypothetical protein